MNTKQTIAIAALLAVASSAFALNCKDAQTQAEMNHCSSKDYEREDARLNKTYEAVMSQLDASRQAKLKDVQRSWLKFRDLQCDYSAAQYDGGSMRPLIFSSCLLGLTKQRNKDLKDMLEEGNM